MRIEFLSILIRSSGYNIGRYSETFSISDMVTYPFFNAFLSNSTTGSVGTENAPMMSKTATIVQLVQNIILQITYRKIKSHVPMITLL
jgi:hypothetical protein